MNDLGTNDAVRFEGVVKAYGRLRALDGLDMTIPTGAVSGFVGPNGAGKTTAFRSMLGLTRPSAGRIDVLGMEVGTDTPKIVKRVGAVVEEPGLHKGLSARDNLRVAASTLGRGSEEVDELLDFVTLLDVAGKKVKGFSKGMRQRLALAQAMLGDPELLVLDEPLDGLDPAGQALLKDKLRSLATDRGITVIVSSHDLADIEQMADHVVVIDRGRAVIAGTVAEIVGDSSVLMVQVAEPARAIEVLAGAGFECQRRGDELRVAADDGSAVSRVLAGAGLYPASMVPLRTTLEGRFLELTEGGFDR